MQISKEMTTQNPYLVTRVSMVDSIKSIPAGVTATFDCREAGPIGSAKACVCRLNKSAKRELYSICTEDNGATYSITHHNRP